MDQSIVDTLAPFLLSGQEEPFVLTAEGAASAAASLRALRGDVALVDAVESLALFACWLIEEHKSPAAGHALLEVAHGEISALEALGTSSARAVHELRAAAVKANYTRYTGANGSERSALTEPTPAGAVSAKPWNTKLMQPPKK